MKHKHHSILNHYQNLLIQCYLRTQFQVLLIEQNKVEEAKAKLEKAIALEPDNTLLYVRLGTLYDQLMKKEAESADPDKAKLEEYQKKGLAAYKKTLELDPDNFIANFNYSSIINEKANFFFKQANEMSPSEYAKKGQALIDQGLEILVDAVPPMEKAYELEPEDEGVIFALRGFYYKLEDEAKLKEIDARIKELGLLDEGN